MHMFWCVCLCYRERCGASGTEWMPVILLLQSHLYKQKSLCAAIPEGLCTLLPFSPLFIYISCFSPLLLLSPKSVRLSLRLSDSDISIQQHPLRIIHFDMDHLHVQCTKNVIAVFVNVHFSIKMWYCILFYESLISFLIFDLEPFKLKT